MEPMRWGLMFVPQSVLPARQDAKLWDLGFPNWDLPANAGPGFPIDGTGHLVEKAIPTTLP